jgi:hypothetical protein
MSIPDIVTLGTSKHGESLETIPPDRGCQPAGDACICSCRMRSGVGRPIKLDHTDQTLGKLCQQRASAAQGWYRDSRIPDTGLLSSRAQRGTFTAASKAPRYARGDSDGSPCSDSRYEGSAGALLKRIRRSLSGPGAAHRVSGHVRPHRAPRSASRAPCKRPATQGARQDKAVARPGPHNVSPPRRAGRRRSRDRARPRRPRAPQATA